MLTIEAISYSEHNFNSVTGALQEDVQVGGMTVGEILASICYEMSRQQTKASDTVLLPDVYSIELEGDMGELPLVIGLQEFLSSVRNLPNYYAITKLESKVGGPREDMDEQTTDTATKVKEISEKHDQESKLKQNATFKAGTDIPTIIRNVIAGTVEFQRLISDVPAPEGDDAQQVKPTVNPANVERYFIKIDSETELLGYDPNRRKYAAKRIYRVHKNLNPRFSYSETNTQQDRVTSMDRLHGLLNFDMVKKAYHYYYTGLNTEVKSVEFKFDNAWFVAKGLYSKLVDSYKRDHGTNAKDDVHKGSAWINDLRENHDLRTEKQTENLLAVANAKKAEEAMKDSGGMDAIAAGQVITRSIQKQAKIAEEIARSKEESLEAKKKIMQMLKQSGDLTTKILPETEVTITPDGTAFRQYNVPIEYYQATTKQYTGQVFLNDLDLAGEKFNSVLFPVSYTDTRLAKSMQDGLRDEYDRGRNIIAEIYQQAASGDMISLEITIRGDSWWIPNSPGDNADTSISPNKKESYMILIADQGEQWEPDSGLMTINDRNSLNGVYCVITVRNSFSDGEFVQTLNCVRDPTIDLNLVLSEPKKFKNMIGFHNKVIEEGPTGTYAEERFRV